MNHATEEKMAAFITGTMRNKCESDIEAHMGSGEIHIQATKKDAGILTARIPTSATNQK